MDSDRRSAQVERLEVVDTGRRRRWSEDEKLKIVLESLQAPRQVAATARRYGVSRSLLLRWRRLFRPEPKDATEQQIGFVAARVVPDSGVAPGPVGPASNCAIEIEFAAGVRMRIAYYTVPTNRRALSAFRRYVIELWRRTLRRRSQKDGFTWERMTKLVADWLSPPRILHPWPDDRFDVRHPR